MTKSFNNCGNFWVPELLSPAGNLDKLKIAVYYGANAVYLGGAKFGLRQASDNFTLDEMREGVEFAHQRGVKVYVAINSFLHDRELEELPKFLTELEKLEIDAVIASDLGVIETVIESSHLPVHLSTQSSCVNSESALFWKARGVSRIVLGREVSISDAKEIKNKSELEMEMFVHGAMCMAYSGNCVISNYTQGRDSNRGGCAHSCRFEYSLKDVNDEISREIKKAYFMSSKDLAGLRVLEDFISAGIHSLKIEGRNKGPYYAAIVTKVYAEALDYYKNYGHFLSDKLYDWESELKTISHRDYTLANLLNEADETSIYNGREGEESDFVVSGVVLEVVPSKHIVLEVKSAFYPYDILEIIPFKGDAISFVAEVITTIGGSEILKSKPGTLVKLPFIYGAEPFNLVRKKLNQKLKVEANFEEVL